MEVRDRADTEAEGGKGARQEEEDTGREEDQRVREGEDSRREEDQRVREKTRAGSG